MKFTLSWLKDHLETDADLDALSGALTAIGLEVEEIIDPSAALSDMVVAEIVSAEKHPDADRLQVCEVSDGTETFSVVCGAPNARKGLKGILAKPGAVIPASGDTLKAGKIRGVASQGMMCSAQELKLGDDHDGIIELDTDVPVGSGAAVALEVEPVIDIALTPNRVDALGVRGVARDLAAAGLGTLKPIDDSAVPGQFACENTVAMDLDADHSHLCPHFVGRVVKGVKNTESPDWLKARLTAIGLRPVSALVDITQYINIDLGRPLHAFDLAKVGKSIGPRVAKSGEKILALNGDEYILEPPMLAIADENAALAIAGVMGGEASSCTEDTTDIFLESALFDPINIARTGRDLGIVSDARYRFERGVDPSSANLGAEIATRMILEICGGEASELVVGGAEPDTSRTIEFTPARVTQLGGVAISDDDIAGILGRLGFAVTRVDEKPWAIGVPSWRRDVEGAHDLVEEVLRIYGYDEIPMVSLPRLPSTKPSFNYEQRRTRSVRRALAGRGLNETTTWSFLGRPQALQFSESGEVFPLENPLSADLDVLRPSLLPNLIAAAARNGARAMPNVALFELGPQFDGDEPGQQTLVAGGLRSGDSVSRQWNASQKEVDAFDAKSDALAALSAAGVDVDRLQIGAADKNPAPSWYHPGQSGTLCLGPNVLANFGTLHPSVLKRFDLGVTAVGFEVFVDRIPKPKKSTGPARKKFAPSPFQPVERDFAFVVNTDVQGGDVIHAVRGADKELIADVSIFDIYAGDNMPAGKKSIALSVRLEPNKATLTDAEIDSISKKVVSAVEKSVDGQLRD